MVGWPRHRRERRPAARSGGPRLERSCPRLEAAGEYGALVTGHPQHPDESCRDATAGVAVADHGVGVSDSRLSEAGGEPLRGRQGMATFGVTPGLGERLVEVDEDRPWQAPGLVGRPARAA